MEGLVNHIVFDYKTPLQVSVVVQMWKQLQDGRSGAESDQRGDSGTR